MDMTLIRSGTTITSREFSQEAGRAKKATATGPVFITDRGRPAHVLLTIEDYRRLTTPADKPFVSLAEALAQTGPEGDFDYDFSQFRSRDITRPFEFDDE